VVKRYLNSTPDDLSFGALEIVDEDRGRDGDR